MWSGDLKFANFGHLITQLSSSSAWRLKLKRADNEIKTMTTTLLSKLIKDKCKWWWSFIIEALVHLIQKWSCRVIKMKPVDCCGRGDETRCLCCCYLSICIWKIIEISPIFHAHSIHIHRRIKMSRLTMEWVKYQRNFENTTQHHVTRAFDLRWRNYNFSSQQFTSTRSVPKRYVN